MSTLPPLFKEQIDGYACSVLDGLTDVLATGDPAVSIRFNARKNETLPAGDAVPWSAGRGFYLPERPAFTLDPALHQGRYYVQEASSMFHGFIVEALTARINHPVAVLDACAAPGGKTTAVIDALPAGSIVVANEFVPSRAAVLRENIIKWGSPDVIVTRGDTARLASLGETFDIVVADVPCSGEGMMRKDPEAVAQWSPGLVEQCVARQREIVDNLWETLKPGGYMIYSTCTFNIRENEQMVEYLIDNCGGESVAIDGVDPQWGIAGAIIGENIACYRFMPHRLRGEGLFVAVVRKPGYSNPASSASGRTRRKDGKTPPMIAAVNNWIAPRPGMDMEITVDGDRINAFAAKWTPLLNRVAKKTSVIHHGVVMGHIKGRDVVPDHSLAMSTLLSPDAFERVEVDRDTALAYLRCEPVTLPDGTPRGHVVLTHDSLPLGFAKHLGNRTNTLYPREWRILH